MSEQDQTNDTNDTYDSAAMAALELEALKTKANLMGVKFHPSITYGKLSEKLKEHEASEVKVETEDPAKKENKLVSQGGKIKAMKDAALALVRVNIVCQNPAKREWNGEVIAVGNRNLPTQKKFVPFNTPDGYHITQIMYDMLVDRECPVFYNERVKTAMGYQDVRKMRRIKEFSITVLPSLTPVELKELARRQAVASGME